MPTRHKLLLLDDDQDVLELYRDILSRLPSKPEIHTATSGARALSLLESEPFSLLISDLNMPKMDGLQVLTIVRRKFPQLRTAVMTSVVDESFRARAYAVGIDLFLEKPQTAQEVQFFLDCIESLLGREEIGGFRGVQSKSLVDIIQIECLSQSSSVLRITNSHLEGQIWIQGGEIIDATVQELTGEEAFRRILGWKTGNFQILPPDPKHPRTIHGSYQGLLLETAQALDEQQAGSAPTAAQPDGPPGSMFAGLTGLKGVEFILAARQKEKADAWGLENPEQIAVWARETLERFSKLGDDLLAGNVNRVEGYGLQRNVALGTSGDRQFVVGFHRATSREEMRETVKQIQSQWAS